MRAGAGTIATLPDVFETGGEGHVDFVRFILSDTNGHKESIMNRFLVQRRLVALMLARPSAGSDFGVARSRCQSLGAGSDAAEPPSAIPSEPDMKAPDQSSEGPKVITPDQSSE